MTTVSEIELRDPRTLLAEGYRILIDTSVFLETSPDRVGGLTELVMDCLEVIHQENNPLVVLQSVQNELQVKTKQRRTPSEVERADKAMMALEFISEAEADRLVATHFGDARDGYADTEFEAVAEVAAHQDATICLLTGDITSKLAVRLTGVRTNTAQLAGSLTKDGLIEIESAAFLYTKGLGKKFRLAQPGGGRHAEKELEKLSDLLTEFASIQQIPVDQKPGGEQQPRKKTYRAQPQRNKAMTPVSFSATSPLRQGDQQLPVTTIPTSGDHVGCANPSRQWTIVLGALVGKGKEGLVYEVVEDPSKVVKIFPQNYRTVHRMEKVELLVEKELWSPGICFPEATVVNSKGAFVGYLMRKAVANLLSQTITNRALFKATYPGWRKDDLVEVCLSFLNRVKVMHSFNILIGDMNEGNLMVSGNRDVWIIDTDSCQFEGYVCPVGWPEFTAPELTSYDGLRTMQHELFAVAMVLFMILLTGRFAYDRSDALGFEDAEEVTRKLIMEGRFPYRLTGQPADGDEPFGDAKYMWSHIDKPVKQMFWHTLHRNGDRYRDRPTVDEWITVFKRYKVSLASDSGWDPMSRDVYPIRHKAFGRHNTILDCPGCGWAAGIAGWGEEGEPERVPALCNRCSVKCAACGDPDQFGVYRDGMCRSCREPDDSRGAVLQRSTKRPSTPPATTAQPSGTLRKPSKKAVTSPPRTSPKKAATPQVGSPTAETGSLWKRVAQWFSGQ